MQMKRITIRDLYVGAVLNEKHRISRNRSRIAEQVSNDYLVSALYRFWQRLPFTA